MPDSNKKSTVHLEVKEHRNISKPTLNLDGLIRGLTKADGVLYEEIIVWLKGNGIEFDFIVKYDSILEKYYQFEKTLYVNHGIKGDLRRQFPDFNPKFKDVYTAHLKPKDIRILENFSLIRMDEGNILAETIISYTS